VASARAAAAGPGAERVSAAARAYEEIVLGERVAIVADPAMSRLYELIRRLAGSQLPVLVGGETGTGKELAASAVHYFSPRRARPLVTVNCAAIAESLLEGELFGWERGAFSGAHAARAGLLESADGGTVFLDEIGELSANAQAKLLRVLESQRVLRVGDTRERPIDLRVVAASNRQLEDEVAAGRFRQDLYFRLSGARLWLPPLRDRPRELPILAVRFLADACQRLARPPLVITDEAMRRLVAYAWPGNVRELKNLMDYFAATVELEAVVLEHLPPAIAAVGRRLAPEEPAARAETVTRPGARFRAIDEEIRELEKSRMAQALAATGGNQKRAAELISMPRRTFVTKLKEYGLGRGDERDPS
jgi:two-component system response regulator AtoC